MTLMPVTDKQIQHGIDKLVDAYNASQSYPERRKLSNWVNVILAQCSKNRVNPDIIFSVMSSSNNRIFSNNIEKLRR